MKNGKFEIHLITIYIIIVASGWTNNGKLIQDLENIYNKKLCYEHHHEKCKESILRDTKKRCNIARF